MFILNSSISKCNKGALSGLLDGSCFHLLIELEKRWMQNCLNLLKKEILTKLTSNREI